MEIARRLWVERLIEACDRALTRIEARDDADPGLVADLEALRRRLRNELLAGRRSEARSACSCSTAR
jgi:hypothetical protein